MLSIWNESLRDDPDQIQHMKALAFLWRIVDSSGDDPSDPVVNASHPVFLEAYRKAMERPCPDYDATTDIVFSEINRAHRDAAGGHSVA